MGRTALPGLRGKPEVTTLYVTYNKPKVRTCKRWRTSQTALLSQSPCFFVERNTTTTWYELVSLQRNNRKKKKGKRKIPGLLFHQEINFMIKYEHLDQGWIISCTLSRWTAFRRNYHTLHLPPAAPALPHTPGCTGLQEHRTMTQTTAVLLPRYPIHQFCCHEALFNYSRLVRFYPSVLNAPK